MFRFQLTHDVYPTAVDTELLFRILLDFSSKVLGVEEESIVFATSVCSDDLNNVELPKTEMIGPFFLGGLDGFPFVGKSGIGAFSHHIPDTGIALVIFGPHVGIGKAGVGKIQRPRQKKVDSDCCGALAGILKILCPSNPTDENPVPNPYCSSIDAQQHELFDLVSPYQNELRKKSYSEQFVFATELIYNACLERMRVLLKDEEFDSKPAIIIGGILINEDLASGSKFALKHTMIINGHNLKNARDFTTEAIDESLKAFATNWVQQQQVAIKGWHVG